MAAPVGCVTFSKKPPTVQEIADQVNEITGLDVRVEPVEGSDEQSISFAAIPEEKVAFSFGTLRDIPASTEVLWLDYATAGGTLLFAARAALESLGGDRFSFLPKISQKTRRKYGGKISVEELLRRHRWEELRMNFVLRPIGYAVGGCFIVVLLLCGGFVRHDSEKLRRKLRGKARSSNADL